MELGWLMDTGDATLGDAEQESKPCEPGKRHAFSVGVDANVRTSRHYGRAQTVRTGEPDVTRDDTGQWFGVGSRYFVCDHCGLIVQTVTKGWKPSAAGLFTATAKDKKHLARVSRGAAASAFYADPALVALAFGRSQARDAIAARKQLDASYAAGYGVVLPFGDMPLGFDAEHLTDSVADTVTAELARAA